ncbi:MAG: hypothetical protein KC708_26200 [Anaerolineae bacterium]|nr:hypothetical protein [Anaerolineae bacterium]
MNYKVKKSDQISLGVFLIGLALLLVSKWWWPGIMFVLGTAALARTLAQGQAWTRSMLAFLFFGIGVVFSIPNLFPGVGFSVIWPIVLVALGLFMLFGGDLSSKFGNSDKRKNEDAGF